MKTYTPKVGEVKRNWHIVDASSITLGRLATQVSLILRGKNKPTFAPHMDTGDFVVVVNAKNVGLTGKKKDQKMYTHYTGFPGGLREISLERMLERQPEEVIRIAVRRMLPDNKLSEQLINKLKIYPGMEHPHRAQDPKPLKLSK